MAVARRFGQKQTISFDVSSVLTKYGKTVNDIDKAIVTLKSSEGQADAQAAYVKNSVDHPAQVSFALDGSNTVVTAIVLGTDFGANKIQAAVPYYMGVGLVLDGEDPNTTFEPDSYTSDSQLQFAKQRVDTIG